MDYRVHVIDSEPTGDGQVRFDCVIQKLVDVGPPEVWQDIPKGHRTLALSASAVLTITQNQQLTDVQKRTELRALFKTEAKGWGLDEADTAYDDIMGLIPSGSWPVDVDLDM